MATHGPLAKNVDQPIVLLTHLARRGMLGETLVVWATEFGRTPFNTTKDAKGREHHAGFYLLDGGWRCEGLSYSYGESDEYGNAVTANGVHVHDFHATMLHLLGLDHTRLTFRHAGRNYRLTDVHGNVVRDILA